MISISYQSINGKIKLSAAHEKEALLCIRSEYAEGDAVLIAAQPGAHLWVQMDAALAPGEVYLPSGQMLWRIPMGEHRLAYSPGAFIGQRHIVSARQMTHAEITARRNVACNPADLRGDTDFYPHCTANVETRDESVFAARNVIDGCRHNISHGEWPYQSWGVGAREDAWCLLDFGREVEIDEMALTLRTDFPHDAYWVRGQVALSDGGAVEFPLNKTGERQYIFLGQHRVRWMRLQHMVKSDDPSAFPSLVEWEVFGRDAAR